MIQRVGRDEGERRERNRKMEEEDKGNLVRKI
jgi:hypothetical protein